MTNHPETNKCESLYTKLLLLVVPKIGVIKLFPLVYIKQ